MLDGSTLDDPAIAEARGGAAIDGLERGCAAAPEPGSITPENFGRELPEA